MCFSVPCLIIRFTLNVAMIYKIETYDRDHELLRNHSQVILSVQPLYATKWIRPLLDNECRLKTLKTQKLLPLCT